MSNSVILPIVLLAISLLLVTQVADSTLYGSRLHTRQSCGANDFVQSSSSEECVAWADNFTSSSSFTQTNDLLCEAACGRLFLEFTRTNCSADAAEFQLRQCERNEDNVRCDAVQYETIVTTSVPADFVARCNASRVNRPDACAPECATLLESLRDNYGCCVNNVFNSSYSQLVFQNSTGLTSYELWTRCNVNTLGFCPMTTDDAAVPLVNNILYAMFIGTAMLLMA